jgi:hypothetical protein
MFGYGRVSHYMKLWFQKREAQGSSCYRALDIMRARILLVEYRVEFGLKI